MGNDLKFIIGAVIATIVIIGGGIFLSSKGQGSNVETSTVSSDVLVKNDSSKLVAIGEEKVVLVEFGDFECPACGEYHSTIKKLTEDFGENMTFVFRNFPLSQHVNARPAAYAAEAAGLQGKYWEMHNYLFETQSEWSSLSDPNSFFEDYITTLGLDVNQFKKDVKSDTVVAKVNEDYKDGQTVKLQGTPTFYLNGKNVGYPNYEAFKKLVEDEISS